MAIGVLILISVVLLIARPILVPADMTEVGLSEKMFVVLYLYIMPAVLFAIAFVCFVFKLIFLRQLSEKPPTTTRST